MKIGCKFWLEKDGIPVFGMGIYEILSRVEKYGSLHKAAQELGMSYRAAWGKVRVYEKRLGSEFLEKGRHGRTGAHLTQAGKQAIESYGTILKGIEEMISSKKFSPSISRVGSAKSLK